MTAPAPDADVRPEAGTAFRGFRAVSILTLASRVLGMLRDMTMAAAFGAGPVMDAFSVAFRIPNTARRLLGEGAQTSAFLPEFIRTQAEEGDDAARDLASAMFWSLGRLLLALVAAAELLLALVRFAAPLSPDATLLIDLLMLLTPYVLCICLAAQQSAVLHALRSFVWPALLPILLNLAWLAAIPVVFAATPDEVRRMQALCLVILAAGAGQLVAPLLVLARRGYPLGVEKPGARNRLRAVYAAMVPILFGVTVSQVNSIVDSLLAWGLAPGSDGATHAAGAWSWLPTLPNGTASALYFGQRMYQFPLGVFGVALGTVLFPQLTRHAARGDRAQLRDDLTAGLGLTLSLGVPAGLGLMLVAEPITALLFQHGRFTADDGALTARMIVAYGSAVWAFSSLLIVQRGYYAVGDRVTPVRQALWAVGVNLLLDALLLAPLGGMGLAWATAAAACLQAGLAIWQVQRHVGPLPWRLLVTITGKTLAASLVMTVVCLLTRVPPSDDLPRRALAALLPVTAGAATYLAVAWLLGLREPWRLLRHGRV
jgi:putative peptidoglycan lipid II flippase